ncbi:MAG: class I adenylate-forming enzyme family protein [Blastococcus sp.]
MATPCSPADLAGALTESLRDHAEQVAVEDGVESLTYRALSERAEAVVDRLAVLSRHSHRRHQVLVSARNCADHVATVIGTILAGDVPFLVDPAFRADEVRRIVDTCGIDVLARDTGTATGPLRLSLTPVDGQGPVVLDSTRLCRFTSGSTRAPACIEFSGTAVLAAARAWLAGGALNPGERILCFAGLYNGLAFNTSLIPGLLSGATLWLPRAAPSAGYVDRHLRRCVPHVLVGFPALYSGLARREQRVGGLDELRVALSSATRLDPAVASTVAERHGIHIADYYGIAETGPLTVNDTPWVPGQQGRPLDGVEIRAGTEQPEQIVVRSPSMGTRYLNHPGAFEQRLTAEGCYRTGDEGVLRDGRLVLRGRASKDLDIGGKKVSRAEVESVLSAHPAVRDAHVLGLTVRTGERVVAALVVADGAARGRASNGDLARAVRAHCSERLAAFKTPTVIAVVPEIPRRSTGKVLGPEASRLAAAGLPVSPPPPVPTARPAPTDALEAW